MKSSSFKSSYLLTMLELFFAFVMPSFQYRRNLFMEPCTNGRQSCRAILDNYVVHF
jgi:hypothetical protein